MRMGSVVVYKHTCTVTGKAYVGVSKKGMEKRWAGHVHAAQKRSKKEMKGLYYFHRAIVKHGIDAWEHEILGTFENEDDAYLAEMQLIVEHGTLAPAGYNSAKGGRGVKLTDEGREYHRQRTIEALRGEPRERQIAAQRSTKSTEEWRVGNRERQRECQNRPDVVEKKREAMRRRAVSGWVSSRCKRIAQLDHDGNVIAEFQSVTHAARETGCNLSNISDVARGQRRQAGGFVWRYLDAE